jgi:Lrp/AsnC family leucine-responsive transcriptional regulator
MTSSDISKCIHLSVPSVAERIRKLEDKGIIERFTLKLNRNAIGQALMAYVSVMLERTENIDSFRATIIQSRYVLECHHLAGEYDYMLKVAVPDISTLEQFISVSLKNIQGVSKTNTVIILSTLKEE